MDIKRFIGGMLEANCYVISSKSGDCFIIDPGYSPKKIIKYVKNENLNVKGIILTHHHYDHSDGASQISKELDCPVMIHRLDADSCRQDADILLEDGDVLEMGEEKLVIINTPGHTKGGICILSSKHRICFTGDTIFNVDLGRTDLEDGSEKDMISSIKNIVDKWGNDMTIYPGHGDPASMKYVRKNNKEFLEIVNGN